MYFVDTSSDTFINLYKSLLSSKSTHPPAAVELITHKTPLFLCTTGDVGFNCVSYVGSVSVSLAKFTIVISPASYFCCLFL